MPRNLTTPPSPTPAGHAVIHHPCSTCGAPASTHIGERGYRWYASTVCSAHVNHGVEADGLGHIDGEYRDAVLAQSGRWQLWLTISPEQRVNAMRLLRDLFHWPVERVARATSASPLLLWEGTLGEVHDYSSHVQKAAVPIEIRRVREN